MGVPVRQREAALPGLPSQRAGRLAQGGKDSRRFTVHGLRRTFNDLARRAGIDSVVIRSITGHVTESMREHYSTVGLDEKQAAIGTVLRVVPRLKVGTADGNAC